MRLLNNFRTTHQGDYILVKRLAFKAQGYLCVVVDANLGDDDKVTLRREDKKVPEVRGFYFSKTPNTEFYSVNWVDDPEYFL